MNNEKNETTSNEERLNFVTETEYRKNLKAVARKRRRRRAELKSFAIIVLLGFFVFSSICILRDYMYYPKKTVSEGIISRNFTNNTRGIPNQPQEDRLAAWDSELPNFIQRDIKEAEKKGYDINYTIGNSLLKISVDETGKPSLYIHGGNTYFTSIMFDTFTNFSIYKHDKEIHLYGYNNDMFQHLTFYPSFDKSIDYTTLTYDLNMPLDHESKGIDTFNFKDYSLYYDKNTQTFSFYSNGKVISSKVFYDSVETLNLYHGIIITQNHMLYRIFAYIKDGLPELKFVFVDDGVELIKSEYQYYSCAYLIPSDQSSSGLPILKKDDDYYVICPNNWEDYDKYALAGSKLSQYNRETDYSSKLINLEDIFVSAEFKYYNSGWSIIVSFDVNGKIYTTDEYPFYGYDNRINLSDKDVEKLSVKVNSIDEIEEHMQIIRKAYESYY